MHAFDVTHKSGQVLKLAPELIQLFGRPCNSYFVIHADTEFIRHPCLRTRSLLVTSVGRVDSQRFIHVTMARCAAVCQCTAQRSPAESSFIATAQTVSQKTCASNK